MLPARATFSLYPTPHGESRIVLVAASRWPTLRIQGGYRIVPARQALRRLDPFPRHRESDVRCFLAQARLASAVDRLPDHRLAALLRTCLLHERVIAVQEGQGEPGAPGATNELRRLSSDVTRAMGGRLSYRGRHYRLVPADDLRKVAGRQHYEVTSQAEARAVLTGLAQQHGAATEILTRASEALSKDWRPPVSHPEGLVLLRRLPVQAAVRDDLGPAITPSQMRAMLDATDEPTIRLVKVEAPVFVPGQETNTLTYAIDGPLAKVAAVVMTVRSVPAHREASVVGELPVPGPYAASGTVDWDGKVQGDLITLKGSPYEISFELTSTSGNTSNSDWGMVRLEIHRTTLVVDDAQQENEASADPFDSLGVSERAVKGLIAELKCSGMPGDCEGKLVIDSPIFTTDGLEMNNDSSFNQYEKAVGKGPRVPLRVQITLKSKAGGGKRSPAVLAGTRILWDLKLPMTPALDKALDARGVQAQAKAFLKRVACYQESLSRPMGTSVHRKLGGWRATPEHRGTIAQQWEDVNDWALSAPAKRPWAAFTLCEGEQTAPADAGVTFYPGRMAGDVHQVQAIVDVDEALDVEDEKAPDQEPAPHRSNRIKIEVWRRVPVVGNWIVGSSTTPVNLPAVAAEYRKAAMLVEPVRPLPPEDVAEQWQTAYEEVGRDGQARSVFLKDALVLQNEGYPVRYREYMEYWERTNLNAGFFGKLWERIRNFFGARDELAYKERCDDLALEIVWHTARRLTIPAGGITALKFGTMGRHNQLPRSDYTAGWAPNIPGLTSRSRAIFFQFTVGSQSGTAIHEIGHALFLAHVPGHFTVGKQSPGCQRDAHDEDQICLMSYHPNKKHLCGLCLLKLAGVDYGKIRCDGTVQD